MAIPKVMGIETEYGITVKNQPDFNPILSSLLLINSYETYRSSRIRWDYEAESPLRDARGFEYMEDKEVPSKEESRLINLILSNGARFYVDHAHPEYSSPETTNPRDCVIWDRAGERILNLSRTRAEAVSPPEQRILIYKNNTDSKGNSYGTHENYLMDRKVPFARIVQYLLPFFVSRQVFTGAGKVGAENNTEFCEFQVSQRADFLETEVGLETMHSRPIINTRDEPHADPEKYRRLHVIPGDANMSEVSNYLKCGTMAIVLSMIEDDFIDRDLSLDSPVLSYRRVSRDLGCRETMRLKDGRALTAVDLQREFLDLAHRYYRDREHEPWVDDVMARWGSVLDRLAVDPMSLARELDWVIKRQLIENYMAKHACEWSDSRVAMIDLQYHDIRPSKGLYYKLEESDAVERMTTEDEVTKAIYDPPKDTRAYFRGMCLQKYADEVVSASWDSVIFDLKEGPLKKIFMLEPLRGTEAHVRQLFEESATAGALLKNLGKPSGDFEDARRSLEGRLLRLLDLELRRDPAARRPSPPARSRRARVRRGERPLGAPRHHGAGPALPRRRDHGGRPAGERGLPGGAPPHREDLQVRRPLRGGHRGRGGPGHGDGPALPDRARALREGRGREPLLGRQGQQARPDDPHEPADGHAGAWQWFRSSPASTSAPGWDGCSSTTSPAAATRRPTTSRRAPAARTRATR